MVRALRSRQLDHQQRAGSASDSAFHRRDDPLQLSEWRHQQYVYLQPVVGRELHLWRPAICTAPPTAINISALRWRFRSAPRRRPSPVSRPTATTSSSPPSPHFPVIRNQEKYQFRYDVSGSVGRHAPKFGVDFIHEPVLSGAFPGQAETLYVLTENPTFYLTNPSPAHGGVGLSTAF